MNYGFIMDNRKCIGCHACTVACKSEHDVAIGVNRTWVKYVEKGEYPNTRRLFSVMRCNHCEEAPCVEICPVEALHIRDDGIVDFDNRRCIGCKSCMQACPYNSLYIDPVTHTAAKCNYCAHRIDIGLEPACVNVCPEHAIISGDMDNPATEIAQLLSREAVKVRKPEKGTRPKLFYIDADEASLTPSETESSDSYMWNAQSSGVGHYAKCAESLIAKSTPVDDMYRELANLKEMPEKVITRGDNTIRKADGVLKRTIRRAYDAPSKGVLWGWEVSAYVMTKAIAAGGVLLPFLAILLGMHVSDSLLYTGLLSGLFFLGLTGALLVKDLDKPTRFAYVILRPQWGSWLVRGGYAITVFGGLVTLWLAARFLGWSAIEPAAMWGSGLFALVVAVYTAFLFAQAKGRDFWQSPALILHMLAHPFVGGGAFFALAASFSGANDWNAFIHAVLIGALAVNLLILFAELTITHPTVDAKKAAHMISSGSHAPLFWLGAVMLGNVLPLLILLWSPAWMISVAAVLILTGLYITEHLWVRVPQLIDLS